MSASRIARPTENAAIGRWRPRRFDVFEIARLREQARQRLDFAFVRVLDHQLVRALNPGVGER
ncbi:hypothetical protein [Kitasatospora sp. NPDC001175]|uniref:hypothetical protein n=1 Tax=Kitasatospora sp. NPDC001175 TaxID=3157103 RepID=UPI003D08DC2E